MQDEILEGHEFAGEPKTRASVLEIGSADPALSDRARPQPFVEPGERVFRGRERTRNFIPRDRIRNRLLPNQSIIYAM